MSVLFLISVLIFFNLIIEMGCGEGIMCLYFFLVFLININFFFF